MQPRFFLPCFFLCIVMTWGVWGQELQIKEASITFEFPSKKVKGSITGFESQSIIIWDDLESTLLEGTVETASLDTDNGLRNWSLRSGRYFDAKKHPKMRFKSSSIAQEDDRITVNGILTLKGISKPWAIMFEKKGNRLQGTATLYSSDFEIHIKKKREDNLVKVFFDFLLE